MTESGKRKKRKHSSPEPSTSASASASAKKSRTSSDGSDDRLSMPTEIKTALTSDRKFPADFLEKVTKLNKDLRENVYRAISLGTEKGLELLKNMTDPELLAWAESLGQGGRALEKAAIIELEEKAEKAEDTTSEFYKLTERMTSRTKEPLKRAILVLDRVIGDKDQGPQGGGVGSPGFTRERTEKAQIIEAKGAHEYIANTILGHDGKTVRDQIRKNPNDENKGKASDMIRKINYPDALKDADGNETEIHAIGLGNDVLAASWVGETRYASPYQQIAREIDEIKNNYFSQKPETLANIIAKYAGVPITEGKVSLTKKQNEEFGSKIREFATIQIAEKGREMKRAQEARVEDKKLVEEALKKAATEGFYNVYVRNTRDNAPFAAEGGQKRLREIYGSVAT